MAIGNGGEGGGTNGGKGGKGGAQQVGDLGVTSPGLVFSSLGLGKNSPGLVKGKRRMWNKEKLLFLLPFAYAYALLFFLIKKKFFFFILFFFFFVSSLCRLVCSAVCQGVCARVLRSGCEMLGFHSVWYVFRVCFMRVSHCAVRCAACVCRLCVPPVW